MKKILGIVLISLLALVACNQADTVPEGYLSEPLQETEFLIGTLINLTIYDEGKEEVMEEALQLIDELEHIYSPQIETSEISAISQHSGDDPIEVSESVYNLIEESIYYGELSDGAFDITIGPLTSMWRFGQSDARKPSQSEIDAVLPLIDYSKIVLDEENRTVYLLEEGMELDLGGIAKGYIADRVKEFFIEQGVTKAIIDLGGDIYVIGSRPTGEDWVIGVQNPKSSRGNLLGKMGQTDRSIVTSGVYERYIDVDDTRYHHLLDPDTGYPFDNDIAGVSIISQTTMGGDALSTAVFGKGIEEGMALIESLEDVEAVFVRSDNSVYLSSGLVDNFELMDDDFEIVSID